MPTGAPSTKRQRIAPLEIDKAKVLFNSFKVDMFPNGMPEANLLKTLQQQGTEFLRKRGSIFIGDYSVIEPSNMLFTRVTDLAYKGFIPVTYSTEDRTLFIKFDLLINDHRSVETGNFTVGESKYMAEKAESIVKQLMVVREMLSSSQHTRDETEEIEASADERGGIEGAYNDTDYGNHTPSVDSQQRSQKGVISIHDILNPESPSAAEVPEGDTNDIETDNSMTVSSDQPDDRSDFSERYSSSRPDSMTDYKAYGASWDPWE
jgi:hypothetical protein